MGNRKRIALLVPLSAIIALVTTNAPPRLQRKQKRGCK